MPQEKEIEESVVGNEHKVPYLSLEIGDFSPRHKFRFVLFTPPPFRFLCDVSFVKRDESIYLAPHVNDVYALVGRESDGSEFKAQVKPSEDLHLSLHDSGMVNLTAGQRRYTLQGSQRETRFGLLAAFAIKDPTGLRETTEDEINNLPKRYSILPVAGFLNLSPVVLSIFRVSISDEWEMPRLSDTFQFNFECSLRNKEVKYEFVVWQNARMQPFPGQVAVSI